MCSIHANSARVAILKLCTLPLLAGVNVGQGFAWPRQHVQVVDAVGAGGSAAVAG